MFNLPCSRSVSFVASTILDEISVLFSWNPPFLPASNVNLKLSTASGQPGFCDSDKVILTTILRRVEYRPDFVAMGAALFLDYSRRTPASFGWDLSFSCCLRAASPLSQFTPLRPYPLATQSLGQLTISGMGLTSRLPFSIQNIRVEVGI
jgi:hypothetical protein